MQFPLESYKFQSAQPVKASSCGEILCADKAESSDWHASQMALSTVSGTVVRLCVDRVGLKDAQTYIDPILTMIVADPECNVLDTQDSPVAKERKATHVIFNH